MRSRRASIAATYAAAGLLALVSVLGLKWIPSGTESVGEVISGVRSASGAYTVTLTNDSGRDASFEVFAWGDYTNTLQTIGDIDNTESLTFTLASGGGSYVFIGVADLGGGITSTLMPMLTESQLQALNYQVSFLADDMGADALPTDEQPVYSTPEDLEIPTATPTP